MKKLRQRTNKERVSDDERVNNMDEKQKTEFYREFYNRRKYSFSKTSFVKNRLKFMLICAVIVIGYVLTLPESNETLDLMALPFLFATFGFLLAIDQIFLMRYYYKRFEYLRKEIIE